MGGQNPMISSTQVLKHGEFATLRQKDRLNGNRRSRDYRRQLVWDAARVSQVGDDEARQVSQGRNCSCEVLAGWLVEVEQDRHVAPVAQFLAQSVEDCFALRGETPKDEYCLLSDGVDDVADFRIIQQEIDELRDLDVVDGNLGLVPRRDNQILLLSPF